jgi:hypothetical protein
LQPIIVSVVVRHSRLEKKNGSSGRSFAPGQYKGHIAGHIIGHIIGHIGGHIGHIVGHIVEYIVEKLSPLPLTCDMAPFVDDPDSVSQRRN